MPHQTILIIGSSGFLGRQITSLCELQASIIKTHCRNPLYPDSIRYDFFNDAIEKLLDIQKIDIVIFAGMVETSPLDAVQTSMQRFAKACRDKRVIYLSSDGVFDGQKGFYAEQDAPNSQTLYGQNLAACEKIIAKHCQNFCIVRPSYIYGFSNGKLDDRLTKTIETLKAGEKVTLFDDMFKSPYGVKQIANAVIALARSALTGIIHVAGQRMSVYEFHRQAMSALMVDTTNLKSCKMPTAKGYLRDTSLDSSMWQNITNSKLENIQDILAAKDAA
ncbi:MAG: hypothetical protein DCC52_07220 [Chloroflexi bacterium]|nr:MAG: hypothetical protein DCC52_07220 [Chloroflexota bacterium]